MYIMLSPSEFVILSTNDMHASLGNASRLASAVKECRDTVFTIVVDAGDRWTGNAYVDLAEHRLPIIRIMNEVGYNVATLGNHEFDAGQQTLAASIDYASFPIICANMQSEDNRFAKLGTTSRIKTPAGVIIDFVGVVTSFSNGHPDGNASNFEGLTFENPLDAAEREGEAIDGDIKVLLSHMGDDRDMELAGRYDGYDIIIGGHTHRLLDTVPSTGRSAEWHFLMGAVLQRKGWLADARTYFEEAVRRERFAREDGNESERGRTLRYAFLRDYPFSVFSVNMVSFRLCMGRPGPEATFRSMRSLIFTVL